MIMICLSYCRPRYSPRIIIWRQRFGDSHLICEDIRTSSYSMLSYTMHQTGVSREPDTTATVSIVCWPCAFLWRVMQYPPIFLCCPATNTVFYNWKNYYKTLNLFSLLSLADIHTILVRALAHQLLKYTDEILFILIANKVCNVSYGSVTFTKHRTRLLDTLVLLKR